MKPKLLVVVCTKAKTIDEWSQRPIHKSLMRQHDMNQGDVDIKLVAGNDKGLSFRYNEALKDPNNLNKTVLFVHDDVELDDLFLVDKLLNSPYSITGLAGTKAFNKQSDKAAWHLSSSRDNFVGEVAHCHQGKVWTTVFGSTNSRALLLDGLFLSCKVKDLVEKEVYFDEDFDFHFYDLAFCMRANASKVTSGVLPIRVIHHGLGDSMNSSSWEQANTKFKEKYCK